MRDDRIELNASYFAQTLRRGARVPGFGERTVAGLEWTVRDLAVHVAGITDFYTELVSAPSPTPWPADFDRFTAERIARVDETDLVVLADSIVPRTVALLDLLGSDRDRLVNFWIRQRPIELLLGIWLNELLVHRYDLAQTMGEKADLSAADARRSSEAMLAFGVDFVNTDVAAEVDGTVALKVRGGRGYGIELDHGVVTVTAQLPKRADWHLSVDPVAFLLVSMGRQGLAKPTLAGKLLGWGRDPRLGLALNQLFVVP